MNPAGFQQTRAGVLGSFFVFFVLRVPAFDSGFQRLFGSVWCASHARPFVQVSQKSIFKSPCQFLAKDALEMAPRPPQGLQERPWDTPTKGPLWYGPLAPPYGLRVTS
jgi:hypothetical protein